MDKKLNNNFALGILAFGSLIDYPGEEIQNLEVNRIKCHTPFNVEFARKSRTRDYAPTLIPVNDGGQQVAAVIIILDPNTNVEAARSMLWRRELHITDTTRQYTHQDNPGLNTVVIKILNDFHNVQTVLYTAIDSNIPHPLTGELLADLAISSILTNAGEEQKDGLRYLLSAKRNGITTRLSEEYENQILKKTSSQSLQEAIRKLDHHRSEILNTIDNN